MAMLDAPAIELPNPPAASYTLRDVPMRHRFPMMRDMMADGHPPFMRSILTASREAPEAQIDTLIAPGWQPQGIHCARSGLGSLLTQYTRALMEEIGRLSAAEAGAALDNLCRLLALHAYAQSRHADPADRAINAARLMQVRRYIDQHLADPALTPASVAAAHRMSQR